MRIGRLELWTDFAHSFDLGALRCGAGCYIVSLGWVGFT